MFCKGGGCTAKLGPDGGFIKFMFLTNVAKGRKRQQSASSGYDSSDDAAVYRISDDTALVPVRLFFFSPMVDDPY